MLKLYWWVLPGTPIVSHRGSRIGTEGEIEARGPGLHSPPDPINQSSTSYMSSQQQLGNKCIDPEVGPR